VTNLERAKFHRWLHRDVLAADFAAGVRSDSKRDWLRRTPTVVVLTEAPQEIGKLFNAGTRVCEDQVVIAAQVRKQVLRDGEEYAVRRLVAAGDGFSAARAVPARQGGGAIAAHLQPKLLTGRRGLDPSHRLSATGSQEFTSEGEIAERRGETDASHATPNRELQSVKERLQLRATFAAEEDVQLIHHHSIKSREEPPDLVTAEHEQSLERLGSDDENPLRLLADAPLVRSTDIAVPAMHRNAQLLAALLRDALPNGAQVGTVDKFQGQQAAVVIYSMTTSAPEEAPRGMEFLYSRNRLNVATSRARCACVLVATRRLLAPECHTPRQLRLANALCAYVESADEVSWPVAAASEASAGALMLRTSRPPSAR
jgi:hypothetical protein